MKWEVSIYIDLMRILAAFAVLAEHTSNYVGGWIWRFGGYGGEAVAIFFVLSGLVIAYVTETKERTWRDFVRARVVRLYSVIVPIMLVTWLFGVLGPYADAVPYSTGFNIPNSVSNYLVCLAFVHQLWNTDTHFGVNGAYWSMGFEVAYYAIFCVAMLAGGSLRRRGIWMILLALLVGPRIVCYLPLWLLGVGCYWLIRYINNGKRGIRSRAENVVWLIVLIATPLLFGWLHDWVREWNEHPKIYRLFGFSAEYFGTVFYFYSLGALFALHLLAFSVLSSRWTNRINAVAPAIRWLAGATFTLYLANLPTLIFLNALLPDFADENVRSTVIMLATIAFVLLLAEFSERRKAVWKPVFARIL